MVAITMPRMYMRFSPYLHYVDGLFSIPSLVHHLLPSHRFLNTVLLVLVASCLLVVTAYIAVTNGVVVLR